MILSMAAVCAKEYISLYSSRRFQDITWQGVASGWLGIYRAVEWADPPVLEYLTDLKFATRSQLLRHFYTSKENGRKRIERMARTGILLRHSLVSRVPACSSGDAALYTLGPLGFELVRKRWIPNWWCSFSLVNVLKHLVAGELYFGFASIWPCTHAEADWPLTAFITFGGIEYGILVLRDDVEQVRRQIGRSTAMRLIVAVERVGDAARLNASLDAPARFILDQELIHHQFSQCVMFRFEGGTLIPEGLFGDDIADGTAAFRP
jgi:hypothetical protein